MDTAYIQGEEINLDGANYSDKNDTTADEVTLTSSMVANFNTETTGNKTMKVLWNNFELEVNYSVISNEQFVNMYNTAFDNLINAEHIHSNLVVYHDTVQEISSTNMKNNEVYVKSLYKQGEQIVGETQEWIEKYNNVWYHYIFDENEEEQLRKDVSSDIINDKVMEYCANYFIGSGTKLDISDLKYIDKISYEIDGTKTILSIIVFDSDYNETNTTKCIIENNKFIGCVAESEKVI